MKWSALVVIAAAAACGSLPDQGGGIVALEVLAPDSPSLIVGHSLTLHARALDLRGDSVAAEIYWRTPDTALVSLDSVRGVIIARSKVGTARIQARVGTLLSNIVLITLRDVASTLRGSP